MFHTFSSGLATFRKFGTFGKLVVLFGSNLASLQAQADTSYALPQMEVTAIKLRHQPTGTQLSFIDSSSLSVHQTDNIADVLSKKSAIYVKSYGMGSIATTAARGGSAGQTAVVWNGFPLQSPMLGQLDFSLLPAFLVDEMTVQYGGNSAAWGSGAIGGAVLLENNTLFVNGLSANLYTATGSFGWQNHAASFRYGNGQLAGSTRLFFQRSKNNFPFEIHPDLPEKRQEHAAVQQQGVLQEFFWKIKPNQELAWRIWLQNTDREIPPTTVQTRSAATQEDDFLRTALHWKKKSKSNVLQARTAFFSETLDYRDALTGLQSLSKFHTWMGETEATWFPGQQYRMQGSLTQTYTRATTPAYETTPDQFRTAVFGTVKGEGDRWKAQFDGRLELADGNLSPFTPSIGVEGDVLQFLSIKLKIARNYRLPTFNDLYWRPGGNPELLPESGWSEDAGLVFHGKTNRLRWDFSVTGFNRRIRNWILWAQRDGQFFYSPQNIAEVWSRGLENRLRLTLTLPSGMIELSGGYDFVRSTNEKALASPKIEAGTQLFYVPQHLAFGVITYRIKRFQTTLYQQFASETIGLNEAIPGFQIGSLQAQYTIQMGQWKGRLFFQIENLWDANYQVIERRPMPGRHFRAGISAGFNTSP